MSNEPALTPVRIEILREAYAVLKDAESLEDAREKFRRMITSLVLGD